LISTRSTFITILFANLSRHAEDLGVFELDERYFGELCVRGKRDRGAAGKTLCKYCRRSKEELMPIIESSTLHTDGWGAYDELILTATTATEYSK
jgi:hypothetical protein